MGNISLVILAVIAVAVSVVQASAIECALCTSVAQIMDVRVEAGIPPEKVFGEICSLFHDEPLKNGCEEAEKLLGEVVGVALRLGATADDICHTLKLCDKSVKSCRLLPKKEKGNHDFSVSRFQDHPAVLAFRDHARLGNPISDLIKEIIQAVSEHKPVSDLDKDGFSADMWGLRGTAWRGKDCNGIDDQIYPGRKSGIKGVDYNCNGIHGKLEDGKDAKTELCDGSGQMGIMLAGDSAGAHFSLPPAWFDAANFDNTTFVGALDVLLNESDWPHRSFSTGHQQLPASNYGPSYPKIMQDPQYRSVYDRLVEKNACNHRDFQNGGVNGMRVTPMVSSDIQSLSRNRDTDHPVFYFMEMVGNDVCNGHHTFSTMTSVKKWVEEWTIGIHELDASLPPGSKVIFLGQGPGNRLYQSLQDKNHPIGVPYPDFYDYLNCLEISPCWGWMNSNSTVREKTTEHSELLNHALVDLVASLEGTLNNIELFPVVNATATAFDRFVSVHGEDNAWQAIEPSDGFHPNTLLQAIISDVVWEALEAQKPEWVPKENPNNAKIKELFGDQGGY